MHMTKVGSYFVGQKRNKINCIALIIQCSNQLSENKEQLANLYRYRIFSFSNQK